MKIRALVLMGALCAGAAWSQTPGQDRLAEARAAAAAGQHDSAAAILIAAWEESIDAPDGTVRWVSYSSELKKLLPKSPAIEAQVAGLRDRFEERLRSSSPPKYNICVGWMNLNEMLRDDQRTLAWFDEVKAAPDHAGVLRIIRWRLSEILVAQDRWGDLGYLHADALASLKEIQEREYRPPRGSDSTSQMAADLARRRLQAKVGELYAGLLASGRDEEAAALAARAFEIDRTGGMPERLVRTALRADEPRPEHAEWLRTAYDKGEETAELEEELARALAGEPREAREVHRSPVPEPAPLPEPPMLPWQLPARDDGPRKPPY